MSKKENNRKSQSAIEIALDNSLAFSYFLRLGISLYRKEVSCEIAQASIDLYYTRINGIAFLKSAWFIRGNGREKFATALAAGGHRTKNLTGNLGYIAYDGDDGSRWGASLIGASKSAKSWLILDSSTKQVVLNPDIPIRLPSTGGRDQDSEYLLLNSLDHHLQSKDKNSGKVELFTERHPCESCISVISEFLNHHPDISISITYVLDGSHTDHSILNNLIKNKNSNGKKILIIEKISPSIKPPSPPQAGETTTN